HCFAAGVLEQSENFLPSLRWRNATCHARRDRSNVSNCLRQLPQRDKVRRTRLANEFFGKVQTHRSEKVDSLKILERSVFLVISKIQVFPFAMPPLYFCADRDYGAWDKVANLLEIKDDLLLAVCRPQPVEKRREI